VVKPEPTPDSEALRLEKRRQLVARIVNLKEEGYTNPLDPNNPFALAPDFPPPKGHWEWGNYRYGMVLPRSHIVIKAHTDDHLARLWYTVRKIYPVMEHFDIRVPCFYGKRGIRWGGHHYPTTRRGDRILPQIIVLDCHNWESNIAVYNALHELAHVLEDKPIRYRRKNESPLDYQLNLHDREFQEVFGRLLSHYMKLPTTTEKEKRILQELAMEDDYAPPIFPDGTVQVSYAVGQCQS
jgi:hypothetical protein